MMVSEMKCGFCAGNLIADWTYSNSKYNRPGYEWAIYGCRGCLRPNYSDYRLLFLNDETTPNESIEYESFHIVKYHIDPFDKKNNGSTRIIVKPKERSLMPSYLVDILIPNQHIELPLHDLTALNRKLKTWLMFA